MVDTFESKEDELLDKEISNYLENLGLSVEYSCEEVYNLYLKFFGEHTFENWEKFKKTTLLRHYGEQKNIFGKSDFSPAFNLSMEDRNPRYNEFSVKTQKDLSSRLFENHSETDKEITNQMQEEFFDCFQEECPYKAVKEKAKKFNLDTRVSDRIMETVWYFRYLGLSDSNVEKLTRLILKIEPFTRGKMRKYQPSKSDPNQKEPTFNHFLNVVRIEAGKVDQSRTYWEFLSETEKEIFSYYHDEETMMVIFICGLFHDYAEDDILTCGEIQKMLQELGFSKSIMQRVGAILPTLNIHNYEDENKKADFEDYFAVIRKYPESRIIKISDIFSNFRSGISRKHFTDSEISSKIQAYLDFMIFTLEKGGVATIPARFLIDLIETNPPVFLNTPEFKRLKSEVLSFALDVAKKKKKQKRLIIF